MCEHSSKTDNIDDLLEAYERQQREIYINRTIPAIDRLEGIAYDLANAYEMEYRANPTYESEERMRYWRYMGAANWSSKSNFDPYTPAYSAYTQRKNEYISFLRRNGKLKATNAQKGLFIAIGIIGAMIGIPLLMHILLGLSTHI
jgi:hypothetical protein